MGASSNTSIQSRQPSETVGENYTIHQNRKRNNKGLGSGEEGGTIKENG